VRRLLTPLAVLALALLARGVLAETILTPQGPAEVFSRGGQFDLAEVLRLTGAEVQFAAAAGSYGAVLGQREVQFTPGGTLAVVDGRLTALPTPVRLVDGRPLGSAATADALLAALGWTLRHGTRGWEVAALGGGERLQVSVVRDAGGTLIVVRGTAQEPRVILTPGQVGLLFAAPVALAEPIRPDGELTGGELNGPLLTLRLKEGVAVSSSYALPDPPRYVVRLGGEAQAAVAPLAPARRAGPLVVLDPGHGGEDQGAKGPAGELEKSITLAVARATAARLQAAGVTARLTREGDDGVSLGNRTALANQLQADAFVSIHANAYRGKAVRGAETYYMSVDASDADAAAAAAAENVGAAPDTVQLILWDMAHVANLNASARLARSIQERFNELQGIKDRGIRQAPFVVLTGATMPAALVEIGFLSNPADARRLTSATGQEELAGVLAEAVLAFLRNREAAVEAGR
jgi:N-acetylmuramoyl-L-alanine amidase